MSERAHVAVVAGIHALGVALAEFGLVLFGVVEVLDPVVRQVAGIATRAVLSLGAQLAEVVSRGPPAVLAVALVVKETLLGVVCHLVATGLGLEGHEVQQLHTIILRLSGQVRLTQM